MLNPTWSYQSSASKIFSSIWSELPINHKHLFIAKFLFTLSYKLLILNISKFNKIDPCGRHFKSWTKLITVLGLMLSTNKEHSKEFFSGRTSEIFSKVGTLTTFGWMLEILSNSNKTLKIQTFLNTDFSDQIKLLKKLSGKLLWQKEIQSYGLIKIKAQKLKLPLVLWNFSVFLSDDILFL